jgi:ABC-type multidrug transport system fused ATPase/permease subunit
VIAEAGRFDELMHRSNGLFQQLYNTQFDLTEETHVGV